MEKSVRTVYAPYEREKIIEKYGKDIIVIIDQFTAENQLEGFVAQKMFFNQEKKNKK